MSSLDLCGLRVYMTQLPNDPTNHPTMDYSITCTECYYRIPNFNMDDIILDRMSYTIRYRGICLINDGIDRSHHNHRHVSDLCSH